MHKILLTVTVLAFTAGRLAAGAPAPGSAEPAAAPRFVGPGDIYPLWSIVGEWRVTHPDWTGIIYLQPDGTVEDSNRKPVAH